MRVMEKKVVETCAKIANTGKRDIKTITIMLKHCPQKHGRKNSSIVQSEQRRLTSEGVDVLRCHKCIQLYWWSVQNFTFMNIVLEARV